MICEYLNEKFPEPPLMPTDLAERARARFMEEYADTKLIEVLSIPFIENFVAKRIRKTEPDHERVRHAETVLIPPVLDYVESCLPEDGFLFGHFCTVDVSLMTHAVNAEVGNYSIDAARWPKYAAYVARVKAHPAVAATLAREAEVMATALG